MYSLGTQDVYLERKNPETAPIKFFFIDGCPIFLEKTMSKGSRKFWRFHNQSTPPLTAKTTELLFCFFF
jgi:hypothetical protein